MNKINKLRNFLLYHNAIPLVFGIIFLGAGATFAASPDARDAIMSSEQKLTSIDNSYLLDTDLSTYPFAAYVISVKEDETTYYVSYLLDTIDLEEGFWRPVVKEAILEVSKEVIADGDLGVYTTKQLSEVREAEIARLVATQKIQESAGQTNKIVTTEYQGLIGQMIGATEEVIPSYIPAEEPQTEAPGLTETQEQSTEETSLSPGEQPVEQETTEQLPVAEESEEDSVPGEIITE